MTEARACTWNREPAFALEQHAVPQDVDDLAAGRREGVEPPQAGPDLWTGGLPVVATFGLARVARMDGGASTIFDPHLPTFVIPLLLVAAIGLVATWAPSRRVRRIDPAALLRTS